MENPFNFHDEYTLENDTALLRPLKTEDHALLLPIALNEPDIWKYSLVQAGGDEQLKKYIQIALEARANKKEYPFIVFDKRTQQFVGSTRFYDIQLNELTLQLGYTWYNKATQG